VERILCLATHSHVRLRGEALYTICNAITTADSYQIKRLFQSKSSDLVKPLCNALALGHETELILCILQAMTTLLNLDEQFLDELMGIDSVYSTIEAVGGFEKVEKVATEHRNQDVFN